MATKGKGKGLKGYEQAGVVQLKDLRKGGSNKEMRAIGKEEMRAIGAKYVEEKTKRAMTKVEQRKHDAELMAESLKNYPADPKPVPGVWEYRDNPKEPGKPVKNARGRAAERKAAKKQTMTREERRAARLALRETASAEKLAVREARKAEREAKKRLAGVAMVEVSEDMKQRVMDAVVTKFELNERASGRLVKILERFAKTAPRKLVNRAKRLAIKVALLEGLKAEIDNALQSGTAVVIEKSKPVAEVSKKPAKSVAKKPAKSVAKKAVKGKASK